MPRDVIGRENAIAVEKQQVRRMAMSNAVVAAAGELKGGVRMCRQGDVESPLAYRLFDHVERRLIGTVVRDDDFRKGVESALERDRSEAFS